MTLCGIAPAGEPREIYEDSQEKNSLNIYEKTFLHSVNIMLFDSLKPPKLILYKAKRCSVQKSETRFQKT